MPAASSGEGRPDGEGMAHDVSPRHVERTVDHRHDRRVEPGTGLVKGSDAVRHLSADVTGVHTLTLQVGDGGDGNGHDNADWAGAQVICAG